MHHIVSLALRYRRIDVLYKRALLGFDGWWTAGSRAAFTDLRALVVSRLYTGSYRGSLGEFETSPDWVPTMDTGQRSARITVKTIVVHRFYHRASRVEKVRNVSKVGRQSETARLHAIRLISLRAFQTFLPDWPDLTVPTGTGAFQLSLPIKAALVSPGRRSSSAPRISSLCGA
jgi:hypothetical protein